MDKLPSYRSLFNKVTRSRPFTAAEELAVTSTSLIFRPRDRIDPLLTSHHPSFVSVNNEITPEKDTGQRNTLLNELPSESFADFLKRIMRGESKWTEMNFSPEELQPVLEIIKREISSKQHT